MASGKRWLKIGELERLRLCRDCDHFEDYVGLRAPTCDLLPRLNMVCPRRYADALRIGEAPGPDCLWKMELANGFSL